MPLNPENLTVRQPKNIWEIWLHTLPITVLISLGLSMILGVKVGEFILDKTWLNFHKWIGAYCNPEVTSIAEATCSQGDHSIQTGLYVFFSFSVPVILLTLIFTFSELIFCKQINTGNYQVWFIYNNRRRIGDLLVRYSFKSQQYSLLSINIKSKFQNRGYGSYFLSTILQHGLVPMYVLPVTSAVNFYTRLGFRYVTITELPSNHSPRYLGRLMVYGLKTDQE
jgi:hypothetical protein